MAVTVAASLYAADVGRGSGGVFRVALAVLAGQLTTGWTNDAIDSPLDARSARSDKPIALGRVDRSVVARAACIAGVGCVFASLWSGWRAGAAHLIAVGLAGAYNAGVKRTAFSALPYLGAFALLPCFVTLGGPGAPLPPWSVPLACALLGAAAHLLNVLPDAELDTGDGSRSLPLRFAPRTVADGSALLLVASSALLVFGGRHVRALGVVGFGGSCALAVAALVTGAAGSRWGFRLACLLAVVDVGLLATTR